MLSYAPEIGVAAERMRITAWCCLVLSALASHAEATAEVVFTVRDRLAATEVAEVTTLYVDGQLIRSFRLDAQEADIVIPVQVTDETASHSFGLCGHILVREPDGRIRKQVIKVTGVLENVAGRSFEAVASDDFTRFYLVDTTDGQPASTITNEDASACTPATS